MLVFSMNPGTSGRATCADAVEQPDTRGRSDRSVNRDTLGEEPLIEARPVNANETPFSDDGEVRILGGEIAKLALGDRRVLRQQAEGQIRGPLGAGINLVCGHRTESPLG